MTVHGNGRLSLISTGFNEVRLDGSPRSRGLVSASVEG